MPATAITRRTRGARALTVAAAALLAACGGGHRSTTGPVDVSGTYALVSIDGHALPATIAQNDQLVSQAKSGYLTLNTDMTFGIGFLVTASGHDSTIAATGTYTYLRDARRLAFTSTVDGLSGTLPADLTSNNDVNLTSYFAGGTHATLFRR